MVEARPATGGGGGTCEVAAAVVLIFLFPFLALAWKWSKEASQEQSLEDWRSRIGLQKRSREKLTRIQGRDFPLLLDFILNAIDLGVLE